MPTERKHFRDGMFPPGALVAFVALIALIAFIALVTLVALVALIALVPLVPLVALVALVTLVSFVAIHASISLIPLVALVALVTLVPIYSWATYMWMLRVSTLALPLALMLPLPARRGYRPLVIHIKYMNFSKYVYIHTHAYT